MATFIFSLQALLDQRLHFERERQLSVAAIERERLELEARVTACQNEIRSHKEDLRQLLGGPTGGAVDTRTVRLQAGAALHARARTQRMALQLAGLYRRLESARSELRKATMKRRAVELLRDKQFNEWKREIERRESRELDEIGTMRAARIAQGRDELGPSIGGQ